MKNGKPLVWILDDEWNNHDVELSIYARNEFEVKITRSKTLAEDMLEYAPYADGVVAQVGFPCDANLIEQLASCKVIAVSGVGFNHVDVKAANEKGIPVATVPDYCVDEVSDHTLMLFLAVTRRLRYFNENVRNGKWDPLATPPIHRLSRQTVGLLGFGRIARKVAQKLKPFGVRLIAHDLYVADEVFEEYGVEPVSLDGLFKQSNVLSLHIPLTEQTKRIVNYERLLSMPKGAFIINTCRGGTIDEDGLIKSIKEEHISGAALDVLETEPPELGYELLHMDEVLITPHSAYISEESVVELKEKTCQAIIDGVNGKQPANVLGFR